MSTAQPANTYQPKGMLIGGKWVGSASGAHFTVENPAKRKGITEVPRADAADVDAAVEAADKAFASWKKVVPRYGAEAGGALANHPKVRKLSFTGSTEVGKIIMRAAAERIVPVSLELGGKSPSIVYPDADEDWAVDGIINAMRFPRQSQSCTAGSRMFLHEDIFDSFLKKLEKKVTALKIGDPLDEASDIGSVINNKQ